MKHIFGLLFLSSLVFSGQAQITFIQGGCNEFNFSFSPTPAAIQWDFGDGDFSNQISPTHFYGNVGSYILTALVNGVTFTDTILVDNCCNGLMTMANEDQCCFDLVFTNNQDQLFTGIQLSFGNGSLGGHSFDATFWGQTRPARPSGVELEYIGAPHIPTGANGGVRICLTADTQISGPAELYTHWMVGPDTICVDTLLLECALCTPVGKTYSTTINSVRQPIPSSNIWDYNETGQGLLGFPDGSVLYGGITAPLVNDGILNTSNNLMSGFLDSCGYFYSAFQEISTINDPNINWLNYKMLDIRSAGCLNYSYAKVGTIRDNTSQLYSDIGISFTNLGNNTVAYNNPTTTPNVRETVNDALLFAGNIYSVGSAWNGPGSQNQIFINQAVVCGSPPDGSVYYQIGTTSEAYGIFKMPSQPYFLVTGRVDDEALLLVLNLSLGLVSVTTYDVDNDPNTTETGMTVGQNAAGDIIIVGTRSRPAVFGSDEDLFFLRLPNQPTVSPLPPLGSNLIDFAGGSERIADMVVWGNDIFLCGTAKSVPVQLSGVVPVNRAFFARLDPLGNVMSSQTYTAHEAKELTIAGGNVVMTGTEYHEGPFITTPFQQSTTRTDIWLAKVDRDGRLAECDCYSPLPFDEPAANPVFTSPAVNQAIQLHAPVSYLFTAQPIMPVDTFCGIPCGTGGSGLACPSGCCGYISGYKYEDRDGDGTFDSEICGWTIELIDDFTGLVIATAQTNQAGFYAFGNLCPGKYRLREQLQSCWLQISAPNNVIDVGPNNWQHFQQNFVNQLEINCSRLYPIINSSGTGNCSFSMALENLVCPDVKLVQVRSTTPGVDINVLGYQPGLTQYAPRPNNSQNVYITGGNNPGVLGTIPRGSNVPVVDFELVSICDPAPAQPFTFVIDYFIDLPCSLSDSYCSDTITLSCPLCPPLNECLVDVTATPTADTTDLCCYDIGFFIDPIHANEFVSIDLRPLGTAMLAGVQSNSGAYSLLSNTSTHLGLISNTGAVCPSSPRRFFPTGNLPGIEICIEDFTGFNPQVAVVFTKCDGSICTDTLTLECVACVDIVQDTVYCEGDSLKYTFSFQNTWDQPIKMLIPSEIAPVGMGFTPDTLFFNPGIPVGGYSGPHTICLDNVAFPDTAKFNFTAFGDNLCCFCVSETVCQALPFCCDTCESIQYAIRDTILGSDSCCYTMDIYTCTDSLFTGFKLTTTGNITFSDIVANPASWYAQTPLPGTNTVNYFHPLLPPPHSEYIQTGWSHNVVQFCLSNIAGPADVPQQVLVDWMTGSDNSILCSDTLTFECLPPPRDTCVLPVDASWTCLPDGSYQLDLDLLIRRSGPTNKVYIQGLHTVPSGGSIVPSPNIVSGSWSQGSIVSMPTMTISGVSPGDSICFYLAASDTIGLSGNAMQACCYTDTLCLVVPPCPGMGAYECDTLDLPNYQHAFMGWAVATCFSGLQNGNNVNPNGFTFGLMDVRNTNSAPLDQNWNVNMIYPTLGTAVNTGQVFGVTTDENGCIYLTATTLYGNSTTLGNFTWGPAGSGGIYRFCLDASGNYNLNASQTLPNNGSGLGNITYDPVHRRLFVSNFSDGMIYQLNAGTLAQVAPPYDFPGITTTPVPTMADFVALGQRIWAVGYNVFENRLYFGVWGEDRRNAGSTATNEIWSIAIDNLGNIIGTARFEAVLPDFAPATLPVGLTVPDLSMPISDLAFSKEGYMLAVEHGMNGDINDATRGPGWQPHLGRAFRFARNAIGVWGSPIQYWIGNLDFHENATGGGDFAYANNLAQCDTLVWITGDALHFTGNNGADSDYIYGMAGVPVSGNTNSPPDLFPNNSIYVDFDGSTAAGTKIFQGDVDVFRDPCCSPPLTDNCLEWEQAVMNQGFDIQQLGTTNTIVITPPTIGIDWWTMDVLCDNAQIITFAGNNPTNLGTNGTYLLCLSAYRVINGNTCRVDFIYDGSITIGSNQLSCCAPNDEFNDFLANGFFFSQSNNVLTINAPNLSDCAQILVNFGDGTMGQYSRADLPIQHTYNTGEQPSPQIKVLDYDDAGNLCNEGIVASRNPHASELNLRIYPNPGQYRCFFQMDLPKAADVSLQFLDMSGKVVLQQKFQFPSGRQNFDVSTDQLPAGSYLVRLKSNDWLATTKYIIIR